MPKVGTLEVDAFPKEEVLIRIEQLIDAKQPASVVTPYSEFVVMAENQPEFRMAINQADIRLADGSGIVWAGHYLNHDVGLVKSFRDVMRSDSQVSAIFPEKISGSDLMYDLLALAHSKHLKVYLLGSEEEISSAVATKIGEKYPNIEITGRFSGRVELDDEGLMSRIAATNSDLILLALSPPKQELWAQAMRTYLRDHNSPGVLCCFGGSFDFFAGSKERAPKWMRSVGLEWFWRLIIEPSRIGRIYRATWVYTNLIRRYKKETL